MNSEISRAQLIARYLRRNRDLNEDVGEVIVIGQTFLVPVSHFVPPKAASARLDIQGEMRIKSQSGDLVYSSEDNSPDQYPAEEAPIQTQQTVAQYDITIPVNIGSISSLNIKTEPDAVQYDATIPIEIGSINSLTIETNTPSQQKNDRQIKITFFDDDDQVIDNPYGSTETFEIKLTSIKLSLDADTDRDGEIEEVPHDKDRWTWGQDGWGAILLVNNDRESKTGFGARDLSNSWIEGPMDLEDLSSLTVRIEGPESLPDDYELRLQVSDQAARRIRIFRQTPSGGFQLIGPDNPIASIPYHRGEIGLLAEGLSYPDRGFTGLITVHLSLVHNDIPTFRDSIVFRVAPWLMLPNTQPPTTLYVCRIDNRNGNRGNEEIIKKLDEISNNIGINLHEIPPEANRGDTWIQDQIEFGYSQAPQKEDPLYVMLDSPRQEGLADYPETQLLGPDLGHVTRFDPSVRPNSLDSFGNLEVSPPAKIKKIIKVKSDEDASSNNNGQIYKEKTIEIDYPFGRILIGGALPNASSGRRIMRVVSDFLWAQGIQKPIELYSDWLAVGHIDEFMTFVPDLNATKGFKLLLASPNICYHILENLTQEGAGDTKLFQGKRDRDGSDMEITAAELLGHDKLPFYNAKCQSYIDWNRDVLKRELGLDEEDIVDLPVLYNYQKRRGGYAAYFPNMVNMIVLDRHLVIPKPYGPKKDKECVFETYVRNVLKGSECHFIDDWSAYHDLFGGLHCGTNVKREVFKKRWWNYKPEDAIDIL